MFGFANTSHDIKALADKPIVAQILQPSVSSDLSKSQRVFDLNLLYPRTSRQQTKQSAALKIPKILLFCEECGQQIDVLKANSDRTSSLGNKKRISKLLNKYGPAANAMKEPKLLTLTSPWFDDPDKGVKTARAAVTRLRHREPFVQLFKDIFYGFHIKPKKDHKFYIHVHALVDTPYIHQTKIAAAWAQCLPGAKVVDIRACTTGRSGLNYILKDVVKTRDLYGFDKEIGAALKGTRLVHTAGTLYGSPLPEPKHPCPRCGSTDWTVDQREAGNLATFQERKRLNSQEVIIGYG